MISILLSILFPLKEHAGRVINFDITVWPLYVMGGLILLGASIVIIGIVIIAVKLLRRLRKTK